MIYSPFTGVFTYPKVFSNIIDFKQPNLPHYKKNKSLECHSSIFRGGGGYDPPPLSIIE